MTIAELLQYAYTTYRGKVASKTPAWATEKANIALEIANRKQRECARDSKRAWSFNFRRIAPNEIGTVTTAGTTDLVGSGTYFTDYEPGDKILVDGETERTIDTITSDTALTVTSAFSNTASAKTFTRTPIIKASVQDYSMHRRFFAPSDRVIVSTSIQEIEYITTTPRNREKGDVYFWGDNPKRLTFNSTIVTGNAAIGGELEVAGYYIPANFVNSTDLVVEAMSEWLIYAVASELARNDPAKQDEFANLLGMANDLYIKMSDANDDLGMYQNNTIPYDMPTISSTDDEAFE